MWGPTFLQYFSYPCPSLYACGPNRFHEAFLSGMLASRSRICSIYVIFLMTCTVLVGEIANFVAYIFAPAVLVTPLGALSIIVR